MKRKNNEENLPFKYWIFNDVQKLENKKLNYNNNEAMRERDEIFYHTAIKHVIFIK